MKCPLCNRELEPTDTGRMHCKSCRVTLQAEKSKSEQSIVVKADQILSPTSGALLPVKVKPEKPPEKANTKKAKKKKQRNFRTVSKCLQEHRHSKDDKGPIGPLPDLRQEKFCQFAIGASNARRAAINAGYTEISAGTRACRLLQQPKIRRRIAELLDAKADKLFADKRQAIITLMEQAQASLSDYITKGIDGATYLEFGPNMPNPKAVKKLKVKQIFDDNGNMAAAIDEIELHNPQTAIGLLAEMLGWKAPIESQVQGEIVLRTHVPDDYGDEGLDAE